MRWGREARLFQPFPRSQMSRCGVTPEPDGGHGHGKATALGVSRVFVAEQGETEDTGPKIHSPLVKQIVLGVKLPFKRLHSRNIS